MEAGRVSQHSEDNNQDSVTALITTPTESGLVVI